MPRPDDTSDSSGSTPRRAPQVIKEIMTVDLRRLSKRTGLPCPPLSMKQRAVLRNLFLTAYSMAVAYDDKMKFLEGVDRT